MSAVTDSKLLVVGGAGFIGSNLVRSLLEAGAEEVVVVDNLISAERENLPRDPRVRFIEGSIADDEVLAALPEDAGYIFHLASYHGNQSSIENPLEDHEHSALATLKLYERIKEFHGLRKVVYASSGGTVAPKTFYDAEATSEDAPISLYLDSPYQISKLIGEFYSNYYFAHHGMPVVKARFQNVYGPGEVLGAGRWRGSNTVWRNVIPTFIYRALRREPLPVQNGGVATRDFIYVSDITRGLIACAERGEPSGVYNLASGTQITILRLAEAINELTGNPTPIALAPAREWDHSGRRFGDPSKARADLGFTAEVDLRDGLRRTTAWTRENLEWIERCIASHRDRMREWTDEPQGVA